MLPATMQVVEITGPGGPDVLRLSTRPVPQPGPGEVLIAVEGAGVNRPDVLQRMGQYAPPPGVSDLPGLEVAGRVVALGEGVTRWRDGDAVCALVAGGGYAEYCLAPEPQCLPIPNGLDAVQAAGLPETVFTVWTNVFERGRLAQGETLLVHGGTSGIGSTAIQMARALGHRVFATSRSDLKCRAAEALGAERAVNSERSDFVAVLREATGGRGVDVVLDMVGGDFLARNLQVLALDGRLVQIAFLKGATAEIDLARVMTRRLTVTGSTLRPRSVAEKGAIARAVEERIWPLIAAGRIRALVHARFPLARAADAHRLLEEGSHVGKIVLTTERSPR